MKYAISIAVMKKATGDFRHAIGFVEADNAYEAEGKALAIARKLYPLKGGFSGHHGVVKPITDFSATMNTAILGPPA